MPLNQGNGENRKGTVSRLISGPFLTCTVSESPGHVIAKCTGFFSLQTYALIVVTERIHTYDNTSGVSHFVVICVSVELGSAIYSNRAHVKGFMYLSPVTSNRQYFLEM